MPASGCERVNDVTFNSLSICPLIGVHSSITVTKNTMEISKINDKELCLIPAPILLSRIE